MYKFTIQIWLLYKVYSQILYSKTRKRFILLYKVSTIQSLRFSYTCTRVEYTTRSRKHCTGISKSKLILVYLSELIVQSKSTYNFKNYKLNKIKINMLNMYVVRVFDALARTTMLLALQLAHDMHAYSHSNKAKSTF